MLDQTLQIARRFIPNRIFNFLNPPYHFCLAFLAALIYGFPSRQIKVIAVTGTKGKSSTVEIINAILEKAGHTTALSNTIRFKVADQSFDNLFKMSMPGRFFGQKMLRQAVQKGCTHFIMEMTSQGALLFRHRFIELDTLVFTNISPEHIEAHGSYENYLNSKLSIAKNMSRSGKTLKTIIVNSDDKESEKFLTCKADNKISYSIRDAEPYTILDEGLEFTLGNKKIRSHLSGLFNLYNILAAVAAARSCSVDDNTIRTAIEEIKIIPGRVQKIRSRTGFNIVVDYAHTADSLEKFYSVFKSTRNICILGGTGGGRDTWKRSEMGRIADANCAEIILTDEDPYDEDQRKIVDDVAKGITSKTPTIIMDRRAAIAEAIKRAGNGDSILITGKGTDPYIMGPNGTKTPWSDARIAEEELNKSGK